MQPSSTPNPTDSTPPPQPAAEPPKHTKYKLILFVVAGLLLLVAGVGITAALLPQFIDRSPSSSQQEDSSPAAVAATTIDTSSLAASYDALTKLALPGFNITRKDITLRAYQELVAGFSLSDAFYKDDTCVLHALVLAQLYSQDPTKKSLYQHQLYLLSSTYLQSVPAAIHDTLTVTSTEQDKKSIAILQSYKDQTLTNQVTDSAVLKQTLSDTAKNLSLDNASKLSTYEILALNFDNTDSAKMQEFTAKYPLYGASPKMWVDMLDGTYYIIMMQSYAKQVASGNAGSLPHEFIHAQSPFVRGDAGRIVEEQRAELFSGEKSNGYNDVKQLFIYLQVMSGIDVNGLLKQRPTDSLGFFLTLYKEFGLQATNGIVFSFPTAFMSSPSNPMKIVSAEHGTDAAIKKAIEIGLATNKTEQDQRIKARYERLLSILGSKEKVINDLNSTLSQSYGMPSAAAKMLEYAQTTP